MIKSLSRGPGFALAALTVAVATASPVVSAQDALEEVIVTGSRIPVDANSISSVPVQSVTEEDIRNSGEINIADIVADIPALVSSLTAENSTTGSNSLNLRGLGSDRSLTLVNGRRHVSGFRGSQAVDVGTIPRALVKSVQVTTGGASAVYGAD
jgi:outer membrane cobalamin receptor